jgi:hypothetical protein
MTREDAISVARPATLGITDDSLSVGVAAAHVISQVCSAGDPQEHWTPAVRRCRNSSGRITPAMPGIRGHFRLGERGS